MTYRRFSLLLFSGIIFSSHCLYSQFVSKIRLFPGSQFVKTFIADAHAHKMSLETIELTRNLHASLGGTFPVFGFDLLNTPMQASFGASVHFGLRPSGQTHIMSSEYYVDYFIMDVPFQKIRNDVWNFTLHFAAGHTSHHLSDTWIDDTNPKTAIHYARDYVRLIVVCSVAEAAQAYIGADYGYIFTIDSRISKPWTFQAGGEIELFKFYEFITTYTALDCKLKQEAGFAATNSFHAGIKMPMQHNRTIRFAYQYRSGLDERGQFFPQHRTLHTLGFYIEI